MNYREEGKGIITLVKLAPVNRGHDRKLNYNCFPLLSDILDLAAPFPL